MKGIIPLLILSFAGLTLDIQAQNDISVQRLVNEIDTLCISLSEQYEFSGSVLIARKGEVILHKGYGWKDVSKHQLNEPEGIYQIGSLTKSFTAQVILKLMEDGKISLTDPVNKYLPSIYPGNNITIKHLLTHTSGIPTFDIDEDDDTIVFHPVPKDTMLKLITHRPLLFAPGDKFYYSSTGYFLLGLIIEKVTGKSYEEVVRKLIFDPLNMKHSGFDFIHLKDSLKATGYKEFNKERQIPSRLVDSTVSYATGGIYSSPSDLYKWAKSIVNNNILSSATWRLAFTPYKGNYGLGFFIDSVNGKKYVGHGGGIMGFTSFFAYFPAEELVIILQNNFYDSQHPDELPFQELTSMMFQDSRTKETDTSEDRFVGAYSLSTAPNRIITIEKKDNGLIAILPDKTRAPLIWLNNLKFQLKGIRNTEGEFVLNSGNVQKLIIRQNGIYEWTKIK